MLTTEGQICNWVWGRQGKTRKTIEYLSTSEKTDQEGRRSWKIVHDFETGWRGVGSGCTDFPVESVEFSFSKGYRNGTTFQLSSLGK